MFVEAYGLTDRKAILPALERSMTGAAGRPINAVDAASLQWLRGVSMKFARARNSLPVPPGNSIASLNCPFRRAGLVR
jgi:hypothetical protein